MYACPVCKRDQVEVIKHQECKNGRRAVSKMPKDNELCVVPDKAEHKRDGEALSQHSAMEASGQSALYNQVFNIPGEQRECSEYEDAMENSVMMTIIKFLLLLFIIILTCFCACWCAYSQLSRRYESLEKKRAAHSKWLERAKSDSESGGAGPKTLFSDKIAEMQRQKQKMQKNITKIAKSGTQGIKQAINMQMQKKKKKEGQQYQEVELNEFEVEVDDDN